MKGVVFVDCGTIAHSGRAGLRRAIPEEVPIAIEFNGISYAVMMGTPADLEDFGAGFALSEGLVADVKDILEITPFETQKGWLLKVHLTQPRVRAVADRVRVRVSESSCGLCGLKNLDQVSRPLPEIAAHTSIPDDALFRAIGLLSDHQPLNSQTGGVHAAAYCTPDGTVRLTREDVGRHNALDKLIGALARANTSPREGFFLLSSRCSYELVEKTAMSGCPTLVTISTATSLAVARAQECGLTLVALARPDSMIDFSKS